MVVCVWTVSRVSRRLGGAASECVCGGGDPLSLTTGRNGRHRPRSTRPTALLLITGRRKRKAQRKGFSDKAQGSSGLYTASPSIHDTV